MGFVKVVFGIMGLEKVEMQNFSSGEMVYKITEEGMRRYMDGIF